MICLTLAQILQALEEYVSLFFMGVELSFLSSFHIKRSEALVLIGSILSYGSGSSYMYCSLIPFCAGFR